jgi:hypothetical protein
VCVTGREEHLMITNLTLRQETSPGDTGNGEHAKLNISNEVRRLRLLFDAVCNSIAPIQRTTAFHVALQSNAQASNGFCITARLHTMLSWRSSVLRFLKPATSPAKSRLSISGRLV